MIKKLSKSQSKALRYVNNARSKDRARPVLNTLRVDKDCLVAIDGFRLHAIKYIMDDLESGNLYNLGGNIIPNEGFFEIEKSIIDPGTYPNYAKVFPQKEPAAIIHVDARFLTEAISRSSKNAKVTIKYYAENKAIEVYTEDDCGIPAYALIMPMYIDGSAEYWRPSSSKEENDEPA